MKRCAMLFLALVVGLFAAPAFSADYNTQLAELRKTNSGARAVGILDAINPLISSVLTTDSTHAQSNTTLANVGGLNVTLQAGKTYIVRAVLFTTANASHGNKVDLGGGTATVTAFRGGLDLHGVGGDEDPAHRAHDLGWQQRRQRDDPD